jgi:hypothetical protein
VLAAIHARRQRRRTRPRIGIAKTAVAGNHVRYAVFDRTALAISDHSGDEILHRNTLCV